jgi:hypothetical protein
VGDATVSLKTLQETEAKELKCGAGADEFTDRSQTGNRSLSRRSPSGGLYNKWRVIQLVERVVEATSLKQN